ncbi:MAG: PIN domain-containing protein [Nitrospirae bacterium]|nr:PIN domain-containing protein [Nitrospirota bacterium]
MKDGKVFVDTNIIIYAYDVSAGEKHDRSLEIMKDLWNTGRGVISTQVLQEFFVNVTRKIARPVNAATAKEIVKDFLKWKTVVIDGELILDAIDIHSAHKYSFWDSMIIASAIAGNVEMLLSEDLSDRHVIKGITVKNPFNGKKLK